MRRQPVDDVIAEPLQDNLFEWHFAVAGPPDSEFEGGIFHGRIILPHDYPFKPPTFMLLSPTGRFETNTKICLSISNYHPEHWQPSWSVRTALTALIAFMPTRPDGAIGSLDYPPDERRVLAASSRVAPPSFGNAARQALIADVHERMLQAARPLPPATTALLPGTLRDALRAAETQRAGTLGEEVPAGPAGPVPPLLSPSAKPDGDPSAAPPRTPTPGDARPAGAGALGTPATTSSPAMTSTDDAGLMQGTLAQGGAAGTPAVVTTPQHRQGVCGHQGVPDKGTVPSGNPVTSLGALSGAPATPAKHAAATPQDAASSSGASTAVAGVASSLSQGYQATPAATSVTTVCGASAVVASPLSTSGPSPSPSQPRAPLAPSPQPPFVRASAAGTPATPASVTTNELEGCVSPNELRRRHHARVHAHELSGERDGPVTPGDLAAREREDMPLWGRPDVPGLSGWVAAEGLPADMQADAVGLPGDRTLPPIATDSQSTGLLTALAVLLSMGIVYLLIRKLTRLYL
eukprot:jgi/Mesvir1/26137/Mv06850-RA.2